MSHSDMLIEGGHTRTGEFPGAAPTGKIAAALAKAQGAMGGAKKDSNNPFYKSKYADLGSVIHACREELAANEIATTFAVHDTEGFITMVEQGDAGPENVYLFSVKMELKLLHSSGEVLSSTGRCYHAPGAQKMGAAMTYLERYLLTAALNIPMEDDDGNEAQRYSRVNRKAPRTRARVAKEIAKADAEKVPQNVADSAADEIGTMGNTATEQVAIDNMADVIKKLIDLDHPDLKDKENWAEARRDKGFPGGKLESWPIADLQKLHAWLMEQVD